MPRLGTLTCPQQCGAMERHRTLPCNLTRTVRRNPLVSAPLVTVRHDPAAKAAAVRIMGFGYAYPELYPQLN